MIKNLRRIIICILLIICSLCLVCACDNTEVVNVDGEYVWTYNPPMSSECDSDMLIDGVLSESRYNGLKYYTHKENGVEIKVTTAFSDLGVYVAAIANDPNYTYTKRMDYSENSCFWLSIKDKDVLYDVADATFNYYIDAKNAWNNEGKGFRAESVLEEVDDISVLTCELFITWDDLNIDVSDGIPDCIRITPSYNSCDGAGTFTWISGMFYFTNYHDRQECSPRFGAQGYINADSEDAVLGNAATGYSKSDGWDLTNLSDGVVTSNVDHSQGIFFSNVCSTAYVFSVTVEIGENIYGKDPCGAGIFNALNQMEFCAFYLNGVSAKNNIKAEYNSLSYYKDGVMSWNYTSEGYISPDYESYDGKVVYTVVKDGGYFYYIVNGQFVMYKYLSYLQEESCPGLFALDTSAKFTNYSVEDLSSNTDRVDDILEQYGIYRAKLSGKTSGGTIKFSSDIARAGDSVTLTVLPTNRYVLTGLTISDRNGNVQDIYATAIQNMTDGKIVISDINATTLITPTFTKFDDSIKMSGKVRNEAGKMISGLTVTIQGSNSLLYYSTITASNGDYTFYVPKKGTATAGNCTIESNGSYELSIKGTGYLPLYDTIQVDSDPVSNDYVIYLPEYTIDSYGIIEDKGTYTSADKLGFRTTTYKYFDTKNVTTAVLTAQITLPEGASFSAGQSAGFVFTDEATLETDKNDTANMTRKAGNYYSKEIGLANSGVFFSSYLIACMSRYPDVWGSGTFPELRYDKENNSSLWTGVNTRTLTLVLYKGIIYIWIDDTSVISVAATDTKYFAGDHGFDLSNGLRFGIFFCYTNGMDVQMKVTETYGDDALALISDTSGKYKDVVMPVVNPDNSRNITNNDGVYTVDSLEFRNSGFAYTSPETYTDTAVYSVKMKVENVISESTLDGFNGWTTNIGITIANEDIIQTAIDGQTSSLNQNYSIQIGLNQYGLISNVGGVLGMSTRLDTANNTEKEVVEADKLSVGQERTLTVVLKAGVLYIFIDGTFVLSKDVDYLRFQSWPSSTDHYSFDKTDKFKFGVNVSNVDTTKNKVTLQVVTEKYGEEALQYITDNYSSVIE